MSEVRPSDLPDFLDRHVIVQEDTAGRSPDEDYREVTGKVIRADPAVGLVLQTRGGTVIIKTSQILDIEIIQRNAPRRLTRRFLREIDARGVRQHLADRHGLPFDLVAAKEITDAMLLQKHEAIDHSNLGHQHGVKPGRKAKKEAVAE